MRAFRFTKIDFIKTKSQMFFLPVYIILMFVIMMRPRSEADAFNTVTVFLYMVFIAIVFSTTPFCTCKKQETGFLLLLPAATLDRILGRFLYGLSMMGIAIVCGLAGAAAYQVLGRGFDEIDMALCLIGLSVGLVLMTAEYVFLYLFGENQGQNLIGVVRVLPGMCFFFAATNLSKEIYTDPEGMQQVVRTVGSHLTTIGWISVAVSIAVMAAAVLLCVKLAEKRDY